MIHTQDPDFTLYQGDALDVLRGLPDESVHCCVTSPPSDPDLVQLLAAQVDRLALGEHVGVLDPFLGSGTTAYVARNHGRRSIGIELNPDYCKLAEERMQQQSLFSLL